MKYVIKRQVVRYDNGTYSPEYYYKATPLGLFNEMTTEVQEATVYTRKSEATNIAKQLGRRFYVAKAE